MNISMTQYKTHLRDYVKSCQCILLESTKIVIIIATLENANTASTIICSSSVYENCLHSVAFRESSDTFSDIFNDTCTVLANDRGPFWDHDIYSSDHPIHGVKSRSFNLHENLSRAWLRDCPVSDNQRAIGSAFYEKGFLRHRSKFCCSIVEESNTALICTERYAVRADY